MVFRMSPIFNKEYVQLKINRFLLTFFNYYSFKRAFATFTPVAFPQDDKKDPFFP